MTIARPGDRAPHVVAAAVITAVTSAAAPARGDEPPAAAAPAPLPSAGDLDGTYLLLGPVGAAVRIEGAWDGAFGAELAWLRVREREALSAVGVALGAARYSARDGGTVRLEAVIGTRALPGRWLAGVSAGAIVELGAVQHPRAGATASAWVFLGVTPYVRAGWIDEAGAFIEAGVAIALPALRR